MMEESSFKSPHNLKAIKLVDEPVDTVVAVLSGRVEKVELDIQGMEYSNEDWRRIEDAVETNRSLRSFRIYDDYASTPPPASFIDHLCMNKTLKNINCNIWEDHDIYSKIEDNSLKSLLVPREKCSVKMVLTPRQWCAVLSGLKDAKTLRKLDVDIRQLPFSLHSKDVPSTEIAAIEEAVATSDQLVKVHFGCDEEMSSLMLSIVKGVSRNRNISELGIEYRHGSRERYLSLLETLSHTKHITCLRLECYNTHLPPLLGDNWCQHIDGPMSRPVCHLRLELTPAEWGVLLSRVHHAKRLEELSLEIILMSPLGSRDVVNDDVVRRVEDVWSNCTLKKVNLDFGAYSDILQSSYNLLGAVMRGITANNNDVNFVLKGWSSKLNKDHLISQLGREHVKQFEVVERDYHTYFISRPHASTENVESSLTSEKSSSEVVPVNLPSPHCGGFDSEAFMDQFSESFLDDVDSHAIVLRLEITRVISKGVAHTIKHCAIDRGNEELFLHLKNHADPDSISKLCDVMRSIAGYPRMSELGRAMKEELDLLTNQTPSDIGLLAVWKEVPKWELPINLGFSLTDVDSLRQEGKDGMEALRIWRNGRCKGFPPTWTSLLNAVERVEGPQVRQKLSANVGADKTWTQ